VDTTNTTEKIPLDNICSNIVRIMSSLRNAQETLWVTKEIHNDCFELLWSCCINLGYSGEQLNKTFYPYELTGEQWEKQNSDLIIE